MLVRAFTILLRPLDEHGLNLVKICPNCLIQLCPQISCKWGGWENHVLEGLRRGLKNLFSKILKSNSLPSFGSKPPSLCHVFSTLLLGLSYTLSLLPSAVEKNQRWKNFRIHENVSVKGSFMFGCGKYIILMMIPNVILHLSFHSILAYFSGLWEEKVSLADIFLISRIFTLSVFKTLFCCFAFNSSSFHGYFFNVHSTQIWL